MARNCFRQPLRALNAEETILIDDIFAEAGEMMELLIRAESFADPRCLAMARSHLETAALFARRAAEVSQL